MRKLFIVVPIFLLQIISYSQWQNVSNGLPSYTYCYSLDSKDSMNAALSLLTNFSTTTCCITTDGGVNWSQKGTPAEFVEISMADSQRLFAISTSNKIYSSTNGGNSWNIAYNVDTTQSKYLNSIQMFSAKEGIVMGDAPDPSKPALFLVTTDGGLSWRSMNNNYLIGGWSGDLYRRLSFTSFSNGWFYDSRTEKIYKTSDTCKTWTGYPMYLNCGMTLGFYSDNYGFFSRIESSTSHTLLRTTDGAVTWQTMITPLSNTDDGEKFVFVPGCPSKVWFLTKTNLIFSSDSGITWTKDAVSGSFSKAYDMVIPDAHHGWFIADKIYRNSNVNNVTFVWRDKHINPPEYTLYQNYPNPFNPITTIKYSLPKEGDVKLTIYDVLGSKVTELVNEFKHAGNYSVQFKKSNLASGIYFYRLESGNYASVKKFLLMK